MSSRDELVTPDLADLVWRRQIDARVEALERAPKLHVPIAHPLSPYGGIVPPDSAWYIGVTAATFDHSQASQPWICSIDFLAHAGLIADVPWQTEAGTAGELRIAMQDFDTAYWYESDPVTLGVASSGTVSFRWLHGAELWKPNHVLWLEARRTAGANNVRIGFPAGGIIQLGPEGCTPEGT